MYKKTIVVLVIFITLLSPVLSPAAYAESMYSDVDEQKYAWAMESINFMTDNDVLKGYSDGTFKPEGTVTKAEFTVMLYRLFDKYRPNIKPVYAQKITSYLDVPKNYWAYKEISELYNSSATEGGGISVNYKTGKYTFKPETRLTRLKLATMLDNFFQEELSIEEKFPDNMKYKLLSGIKDLPAKKFNTNKELDQYLSNDGSYLLKSLEDYNSSDKLYPAIFITESNDNLYLLGDLTYLPVHAIVSMQSYGIITADANGYYRPLAPVTRAELVTILDRLYMLFEKNGVLKEYSTK